MGINSQIKVVFDTFPLLKSSSYSISEAFILTSELQMSLNNKFATVFKIYTHTILYQSHNKL
jgi:hypothetical protein